MFKLMDKKIITVLGLNFCFKTWLYVCHAQHVQSGTNFIEDRLEIPNKLSSGQLKKFNTILYFIFDNCYEPTCCVWKTVQILISWHLQKIADLHHFQYSLSSFILFSRVYTCIFLSSVGLALL